MHVPECCFLMRVHCEYHLIDSILSGIRTLVRKFDPKPQAIKKSSHRVQEIRKNCTMELIDYDHDNITWKIHNECDI